MYANAMRIEASPLRILDLMGAVNARTMIGNEVSPIIHVSQRAFCIVTNAPGQESKMTALGSIPLEFDVRSTSSTVFSVITPPFEKQ